MSRERVWRLVQYKPCDGAGCCGVSGLFGKEGLEPGPCRYWTGTRCDLMLKPRLLRALTVVERRAFVENCLGWPSPHRLPDPYRTFTDGEREATNLKPQPNCCWRWEETLREDAEVTVQWREKEPSP